LLDNCVVTFVPLNDASHHTNDKGILYPRLILKSFENISDVSQIKARPFYIQFA